MSVDASPIKNEHNQSQIAHVTSVPFSGTIAHNVYNVSTNFRIDPIAWTLFFYGSRSKDGDGAGCVLVDPKGTKTMIACRLEFKCTNNVAEYEALVQGLKKTIDMGAKIIG